MSESAGHKTTTATTTATPPATPPNCVDGKPKRGCCPEHNEFNLNYSGLSAKKVIRRRQQYAQTLDSYLGDLFTLADLITALGACDKLSRDQRESIRRSIPVGCKGERSDTGVCRYVKHVPSTYVWQRYTIMKLLALVEEMVTFGYLAR